MMVVLVNVIGILLIAFIVWWFWIARASAVALGAQQKITIEVKDGVYQPATIAVDINRPVTFIFVRKDPSPCAEYVIFKRLEISRQLPLDQPVEVSFKLAEPGEYEFTCQMGMYRGRVIAR